MLKHLVGLDGCWEPPSEGACSAWSRLGPKAAWDKQAAGRASVGRVHHLLGGATPATPVIDIKSKFGQHFPPVVGGGLKLFSRPLALQRKSQSMNHHKGPPTCTAVSGKLAVGAEHRPMLASLVSNSTRWRGLEWRLLGGLGPALKDNHLEGPVGWLPHKLAACNSTEVWSVACSLDWRTKQRRYKAWGGPG